MTDQVPDPVTITATPETVDEARAALSGLPDLPDGMTWQVKVTADGEVIRPPHGEECARVHPNLPCPGYPHEEALRTLERLIGSAENPAELLRRLPAPVHVALVAVLADVGPGVVSADFAVTLTTPRPPELEELPTVAVWEPTETPGVFAGPHWISDPQVLTGGAYFLTMRQGRIAVVGPAS